MVAARFKRHIHSAATRSVAGSPYGIRFRMRPADLLMVSFTDDMAVPHDDGADHGIRTGSSAAPFGERQSPLHEGKVLFGDGHGQVGRWAGILPLLKVEISFIYVKKCIRHKLEHIGHSVKLFCA